MKKLEDVIRQGSCKILWRKLRLRRSLLLVLIQIFGGGVGLVAYLSLSGSGREVGWGGCLFEAGRLLTFSAFRMGAYSRWALIRGWALIRINHAVNTWKISGMLIVWWAITCSGHVSKPQNHKLLNYFCCLRFSFLLPYWLFPCNTITFHKYFWCSRFCEFHSKTQHFTVATKITSRDFVLTNQAFKNVLLLEKLSVSCVKLLDERPLGKHRVFIPGCSLRTAERNI